MNVPGLGRHLFWGRTAALKGINTVIANISYLDVDQFKVLVRKDTECPTIHYLDLEPASRGNYQTEAAFPTTVISGHTIPTGSALASRLLRWLTTSQERGHGGDHPSCNNGTAVYHSFYGRARSPGATYYSFSWRLFDQWWHHGGDLYFHRDYVLCGAHDYTRADNRYHYCYTSDADSCHGGGGERKSVTSGWSIRMSASPTTTATTARPRRSSNSSARLTLQSTKTSVNGTGARPRTCPGAC